MNATKAGIIVGGVLIVVAIALFVIFGGKTSDDDGAVATATEITKVQEVTVKEEVTTVHNQEEQSDAQAVPTMVMIDEASLTGLTSKQATEVGYIARKSIYLSGEQLYYVLDVMLGDNRVVNYYVSEGGYYLLNVNDKVSVTYTTYTNTNGLSFIQVASVTTLE